MASSTIPKVERAQAHAPQRKPMPKGQLLFEGRWRDSADGATMPVFDPTMEARSQMWHRPRLRMPMRLSSQLQRRSSKALGARCTTSARASFAFWTRGERISSRVCLHGRPVRRKAHAWPSWRDSTAPSQKNQESDLLLVDDRQTGSNPLRTRRTQRAHRLSGGRRKFPTVSCRSTRRSISHMQAN
jgi:hypothetical protein